MGTAKSLIITLCDWLSRDLCPVGRVTDRVCLFILMSAMRRGEAPHWAARGRRLRCRTPTKTAPSGLSVRSGP